MTTRCVKLGRVSLIIAIADHWAVKAGDTWYEITTDNREISGKNVVHRSKGESAASGAGEHRGNVVGETTKTDDEILVWIKQWLIENKMYHLFDDNCQKFALEFIDYLTDSTAIVCHSPDSAVQGRSVGKRSFACSDQRNAIAAFENGRVEASLGYINGRATGPSAKVQSIDGPGYGAFGEASLCKVEMSVGKLAGVHVGPNVNTGIGVRNGNAELHVLGFGGKVGSDGIEVNTPVGGAHACSIM